MAGAGDEIAAAGGYFLASDADRRRVVDTLKAAYAEGRLTEAEFGARVARTAGSRTYAQLGTLTADIPVGPAGAWPGEVWPGGAWASEAWPGGAWAGAAWAGGAWPGAAWPGGAWAGGAWAGGAWVGGAWPDATGAETTEPLPLAGPPLSPPPASALDPEQARLPANIKTTLWSVGVFAALPTVLFGLSYLLDSQRVAALALVLFLVDFMFAVMTGTVALGTRIDSRLKNRHYPAGPDSGPGRP